MHAGQRPARVSAANSWSIRDRNRKNVGSCSTSWHTSVVSWLGNRRLPGGDLLIKIPDGDPYPTIMKLDRHRQNCHQECWSCSDKALALAPGDSRVQRHTAVLMRALGRLPEAIAAARKATELDPLSSTGWMVLSDSLTVNRQSAAAHEAIRRALEIQPESTSALDTLGTLQLLEGKALEALATFRQMKDEGGVAMAEHTLGHAEVGERT